MTDTADTISLVAPDRLRGAEATAREIAQQPDVWRETAEIVRSRRADLDAFLAPILAEPRSRIVLTGAGTSAFAGGIAAPALARRLGRRIDAVPTTDIVSNPGEVFAEDVPTLLVSFARSGNSPESVAATEIADASLADVRHLVLTCDPAGRLARNHADRPGSLVVLMPARANDAGFAMTSSLTSMLLACLGTLAPASLDAVGALAEAGRGILTSRRDAVAALAGEGYERIVYLGSGPLTALARESALKLLELTAGGLVTYFDSSLGFRHGPKSVLDARTLVIVYVSSDSYTRQYDLDIVRELRATIDPADVIRISAEGPAEVPQDWVLDGLAGLDDADLAIAYVLVAQLLGLDASLAAGLTPDNPFPGGAVNRVVQGVTIHDLPASEVAR